MSRKEIYVINGPQDTGIRSYFTYKDACNALVEYYISRYTDDSIFELKSIEEIVESIENSGLGWITVKLVDNNFKFDEFDFSFTEEINKYTYLDGILVTNIGLFKLSEEEFEKFKTLILFK